MSTSNRYSDHHDLTLNEICVTAMIPDLDIYRGASIVIREHGEDAPLETAQRRQCPLFESEAPAGRGRFRSAAERGT
jgi:hypothetical protein